MINPFCNANWVDGSTQKDTIFLFRHNCRKSLKRKISSIIAQSKTGLGCLKNKETQQAAGMNQAKNGLVETDSKLSPLKVGHNWTTQKPKLDFDCLHEFMATIGHKSNPAKNGRKLIIKRIIIIVFWIV